MIGIIDYGVGNLRSVQKAFENIGYDAVVTADKAVIAKCSHIVLPGVGAFKDAINCLNSSGMSEVIKSEIAGGKPFLGICLGMQMLFDTSTEDGINEGLRLMRGNITRFDIDLKVPHIGWNRVEVVNKSVLYDGIDDLYFYFVHSYQLASGNSNASGICEYGVQFCCSVERDKVFGVQFHPEKSGDSGLKLLRNFAEIR